MRDSRKALAIGTELMQGTGVTGSIYTIKAEIGRGASCIVYLASYKNTLGEDKSVYIKECYPHSIDIDRDENGYLSSGDVESFNDHKNRFRESFSLCNRIYETEGLVNATSNYLDIFEKNNTLYTVIARAEGHTIADIDDISLKGLTRVLISTAKSVRKMHDEGYLYLDLKPENIYVLEDMNESVQLIDHDSMIPIDTIGDISDYRISYSKGFAPMELREGRIDRLDKYSDVYGIGAVLFYQIFNRAPDAMDTDPFAEYDFGESKYPIEMYRDRMFVKLENLFRKTIAVMPEDRYSDMSPVIEALIEIEAEADTTVPFIRESYYPVRTEVIGRENEIGQVCDFIDGHFGCLFIYGMGGIGKSTIVRTALDKKRSDIDTVAYLYYHDSLIETICDDRQLMVNTVEKMLEETSEEYFERKLQVIHNITEEISTVLVIDNFTGELGEAFSRIREAFSQVIVISRDDPEVDDDSVIHVIELDNDECEQLFHRYYKCEADEADERLISRIIKNVGFHTLAIEIIAKQARKGLLTLQRAVEITSKAGFADGSDGQVAFARDGVHKHRALLQILQDVFAIDNLTPTATAMLQMLQLFDSAGVHREVYAKLCGGDNSSDIIKDLISSGWISESDSIISIHPVIGEVVLRLRWGEISVDVARSVMSGLPEWANEHTLQILKAVSNVKPARRTNEYYSLQWSWTSKNRRDEEAFLTDIYKRIDEAFLYSDPIELIEGADFVCFVLEEMGDFDSALDMLDILRGYVYDSCDNYLIARYEATSSQFYDNALGGGYADNNRHARKLKKCMQLATRSSIEHMRVVAREMYGKNKGIECDQRKKDSILFLITYLLENNVLMIREYRGRKRERDKIRDDLKGITRMLKNADKIFSDGDLSTKLNEVKGTYYLTLGWYHTMVDVDRAAVLDAIDALHDVPSPWKTLLDHIDFDIVPCAEMLYRIGFSEESKDMLLEGVAICDEHPDVEPYIRKRAELEEHIIDVSM